MERFAFVIHPMEPKRDIARKYPFVKYLPDFLVEEAARRIKPKMVSHITGIVSATGTPLEGWFIGCPLTPRQLLGLPVEEVYTRLVQCGEIAADLGAKIIGLGALTSVAGDGGITVASRLPIAVTTGNSYTVATAVEGAKRGAALMDTPLDEATVAVVGAAGSIGQTCAMLLARDVPHMVLIGRDAAKLQPVADAIREQSPHCIVTTTENVAEGLKNADIIVTVTSAVDAVILPEHLKPGAVVCDVARPRDVSVRVAKERNDVLVIEGGVVAVPGQPQFNFHFGFPEGSAYACMSETMMLALEGKYESFTLGKTVSVAQAEETERLAAKHGFRLAGFRSFEKEVTPEAIARVRKAAGRNK